MSEILSYSQTKHKNVLNWSKFCFGESYSTICEEKERICLLGSRLSLQNLFNKKHRQNGKKQLAKGNGEEQFFWNTY